MSGNNITYVIVVLVIACINVCAPAPHQTVNYHHIESCPWEDQQYNQETCENQVQAPLSIWEPPRQEQNQVMSSCSSCQEIERTPCSCHEEIEIPRPCQESVQPKHVFQVPAQECLEVPCGCQEMPPPLGCISASKSIQRCGCSSPLSARWTSPAVELSPPSCPSCASVKQIASPPCSPIQPWQESQEIRPCQYLPGYPEPCPAPVCPRARGSSCGCSAF